MKYIKYILIICPIILSILLTINIYKYINIKNNNTNIIENTNIFKNNFNKNINKQEELQKELNKLKENNKDKIIELNRWIKWNKEIQEKIN